MHMEGCAFADSSFAVPLAIGFDKQWLMLQTTAAENDVQERCGERGGQDTAASADELPSPRGDAPRSWACWCCRCSPQGGRQQFLVTFAFGADACRLQIGRFEVVRCMGQEGVLSEFEGV